MLGVGLPSDADLKALANIKEWQAGVEFDREWGEVESFAALAPKPRRVRRPSWWGEATPAVRRAYLAAIPE